MKLLLTSEAKHPDTLAHMKNFVGGFEGKRILYIPTAANGMVYGQWKTGGSINVVQTLGAQVDVVELENSVYEDVISPLKKADIVWIAGGMVGYLLYWMRRTHFDKALLEVLDKGISYVGSSAGSMILGKNMEIVEWPMVDAEYGAGIIPGLGLLDFEIYPHFEEELKPEIEKNWNSGKLYLLKNGEAVTVVDDKVTVLGEERVIIK